MKLIILFVGVVVLAGALFALSGVFEGRRRAHFTDKDADGFMLIGDPDHLDEFSDLVREAAARSGEEFVAFAVSEGGHRYSEMFVMPLDWPLTSD